MNTHVCKNCETAFVATQKKTPYQKASVIVTVVILAMLAWLAAGSEKPAAVLFMLALIVLRIWLYLRATSLVCPSCKSNDCVGIETPAGKRIAGK
jgi:hypothetical protein